MPLTEQGKADIEALGAELYITNTQGEVWVRPGRLAKLLAVLEASEKLRAEIRRGPVHFVEGTRTVVVTAEFASLLACWDKAIAEARGEQGQIAKVLGDANA